MNARRAATAVLGLLFVLSLAGCGKGGSVKLPFQLPGFGGPGFDKTTLENTIDDRFGGVGTCLIVADAKSGQEVYRYNSNGVCMNRMPPCETYEIPGTLMALDAGVITPETRLKWDGTPQPVAVWQQDADLKTAFANSIPWWQAQLAQKLGFPRIQQQLKAFDYGNGDIGGSIDSFWMGPAHGGQLGISTRGQTQFLRRLYAGQLPAQPQNALAVKRAIVDETRGQSTISGRTGACSTLSDGSRHVAWYVGRLETPKHDWVFAASLEGETKNAMPGMELAHRVKFAFSQAGMWPSGS